MRQSSNGETIQTALRSGDRTAALQSKAEGVARAGSPGEADAGDVPAPGDYDNDGRTDLAVFSAGNWTIKLSADGATRTSATPGGSGFGAAGGGRRCCS